MVPLLSVFWSENHVLWSARGYGWQRGRHKGCSFRHLWVCCSQNSAIAPLGPFLHVVWEQWAVLSGSPGSSPTGTATWLPRQRLRVKGGGRLVPRVLQISECCLQNTPRWLGPGKTNTFTSVFTAKMICLALNCSPNVLSSGIMLLSKPSTWKASFMWLLLWWPKCQGFTRAAYPLIKQNQWIYADSFRCCGNLSNLSPAYVSCWILPQEQTTEASLVI